VHARSPRSRKYPLVRVGVPRLEAVGRMSISILYEGEIVEYGR